MTKTDEQWRTELTPEEYQVLRKAGTERPFTGEYWDTTTEGVYECRACGQELFTSNAKFDAGCGWPSFFAPLAEDRVRYIRDSTWAWSGSRCAAPPAIRTWATSSRARASTPPPTSAICMNSVSLRLKTA